MIYTEYFRNLFVSGAKLALIKNKNLALELDCQEESWYWFMTS
jgi:hypothetical protein